ncbi:hypothetical protein [Legionella fairfieldensis]|uniref:hypothetical protein n=1 Tax=Legionella fairfieldensis TaxID=45064 RepID=UPI000490ED75|nr:hypothetical protein [Legionella fairfieldensis]
MPSVIAAKTGMTSERLHNHNCFFYLKALELSNPIIREIKTIDQDLANDLDDIRRTDIEGFKESYPYADLYTRFFSVIENNIETITQLRDKLIARGNSASPSSSFLTPYLEKNHQSHKEAARLSLQDWDKFIMSIYDNKNRVLEHTYEAIQPVLLNHNPSAPEISKSITDHLQDTGKKINKQAHSPAELGAPHWRLHQTLSSNLKLQHGTSLATHRSYHYTKSDSPQELRFGTQGQRHNGVERVSPLFEHWLNIQDNKKTNGTHLYINNLGRDREDWEGKKESRLTEVLHELEKNHKNIVVITLPADKGLMHRDEYKKIKPVHEYDVVYNEFLHIALQDGKATQKIQDFYISPKVRELLFKDKNPQEELKNLLDKSFSTMGIAKGSYLSSAQRQAVWFHFIKFELTNYIINTLKPTTFNISCKDAIDRGGVASAYYNLLKSFEKNEPLSRDEFERALHAAAAMVKGRGVNHHALLNWNALNTYINANYDVLRKNAGHLITWRDLNCPHNRVSELLNLRVQQAEIELRELELNELDKPEPDEQFRQAVLEGQKIIAEIKNQTAIGVSGKRLLLETVTRVSDLLIHHNPESYERNARRLEELSEKLVSKYPLLQTLRGYIKRFIGYISHTEKLVSKGEHSVHAAKTFEDRKNMQRGMKNLITCGRPATENKNTEEEYNPSFKP